MKIRLFKEKSKGRYPNRVGRRILMLTSIVMLVLGLSFSMIGLIFYSNGQRLRDQDMIGNMISLLEDNMDVDDLEECIMTDEASAKYLELRTYMVDMSQHFTVRNFYIFVPLNDEETDNLLIVCTGLKNDDSESTTDGQGGGPLFLSEDICSPRTAAKYLKYYGKDKEIHFLHTNHTSLGSNYTGVKTVYNSAGDPVAMIGVDIPIGTIVRRGLFFLLFMILCTDTMVILFQFFMFRRMQKTLIDPINRLTRSAEKFAVSRNEMPDPKELHFNDPDVHTHDEIEELADTMKQMAEDMKSYITNLVKTTGERERIETELKGAAKIQEDMLPCVFPHLPGVENVELYAKMKPAREVGGDFYDYFAIDPEHMGIVIADVSGKGVSASLFMVIAKTLIKSHALSGKAPAEVLGTVNDQLCENNTTDMFVTVWLGILDLTTGIITAVNAGHEYPMIRRQKGSYALYKDRHGLAVSAMEGVQYKEYTIEMKPGDSLFLYTDGVPEATNISGEMFGTDNLVKALNCRDMDETNPMTRVALVSDAVRMFVGSAEQFDDMTMFCIVYKGPKDVSKG